MVVSSPDPDDSAEAAPDGGAGVQHQRGAVEAVVEVGGGRHHHRPLAAVQVLCSQRDQWHGYITQFVFVVNHNIF